MEQYQKITTMIRTDIKKKMDKEGVSAKLLINLGWLAYKENPQMLIRLRKLEADVESQKQITRRLYERLANKT